MSFIDSIASFLIVGAVVGVAAGSLAKDVKAMAGGGTLGAVLGTVAYIMVRLAALGS